MTSISAPKSFSKFAFTGVLTNGMTILVSDPTNGANYQLTPNVLMSYVRTALLPVQSSQLAQSTVALVANTVVDQTFNGKTLYANATTDIQLTMDAGIQESFFVQIVNLSSTANVNINFNGANTSVSPTLQAGWLSLLKVANTFVGRK
jgi:hypothetical protein